MLSEEKMPIHKSHAEQAEKPSYGQYVEAQSNRNPSLKNLTGLLASARLDADQHSGSRIHALEFFSQSIPVNNVIDRGSLASYATEDFSRKEKLCGRILLVENPSVDIIEILGSSLDINPLFFASHVHAPSPGITSQTPQSALLPSQLKSLGFVTHHYHKILSFEGLPSLLPEKLFRDANYPRKVVLLPATRGARIGIAQHCCSVLQVKVEPTKWFCKTLDTRN